MGHCVKRTSGKYSVWVADSNSHRFVGFIYWVHRYYGCMTGDADGRSSSPENMSANSLLERMVDCCWRPVKYVNVCLLCGKVDLLASQRALAKGIHCAKDEPETMIGPRSNDERTTGW